MVQFKAVTFFHWLLEWIIVAALFSFSSRKSNIFTAWRHVQLHVYLVVHKHQTVINIFFPKMKMEESIHKCTDLLNQWSVFPYQCQWNFIAHREKKQILYWSYSEHFVKIVYRYELCLNEEMFAWWLGCCHREMNYVPT